MAAPVRSAHMGASLARPFVGPVWAWAARPERRAWAPRVVIALVLVLVLLPFDGMVARWVRGIRLGGDVRRELEAFQQYGQGLSSLLIATVIWIQDPARRRRLADWAAAFVATWAVVFGLKTLVVGRPRPKFDDPWMFLGPFGQYPVRAKAGVRHAWEVWGGISSDLWSMPSAHTAYACVMAVVVGMLYPKLRWVAWVVAGLVAVGRVVTGAHYVTDVVAAWAIGTGVAAAAMEGAWGEWFFVRWRGRAGSARAGGDGERSEAVAEAAEVRSATAEARAE